MMRRQMTPAEMRERSEMCRRERQHLLRYALWNSRRIREEREREKATAAAAPHNSPPKLADAVSPKRLPLQPIENASLNPRLAASSGEAKCSSDEDTSSDSNETSSSDADSDDLDEMLDRLAKLDSPVCPSRLTISCAERSEVEVAESSSSSDDTDTSSEVEVDASSGSSSDDIGVLEAEAEAVDSSSNIDDVERLLVEVEAVNCSSSSDDVERLPETEVVDSNHSSDESDDSWSDCDSDDGDGCSCCVISAGRSSGYSDRDVAVFFQRVSKRFNAMITSVHQTRI